MTRSAATCHPDRPVTARGLCNACYLSARRHGTLPERTEHPGAAMARRRLRAAAGRFATATYTYEQAISARAAAVHAARAVGLTNQEIADELGVTESAVRKIRR